MESDESCDLDKAIHKYNKRQKRRSMELSTVDKATTSSTDSASDSDSYAKWHPDRDNDADGLEDMRGRSPARRPASEIELAREECNNAKSEVAQLAAHVKLLALVILDTQAANLKLHKEVVAMRTAMTEYKLEYRHLVSEIRHIKDLLWHSEGRIVAHDNALDALLDMQQGNSPLDDVEKCEVLKQLADDMSHAAVKPWRR